MFVNVWEYTFSFIKHSLINVRLDFKNLFLIVQNFLAFSALCN